MCNANTFWQYHTDDITITVDNDPHSEEVCRDGDCGFPVSFVHRGGRQSSWWARILNSGETVSMVTRTAREAR